MPWQFLVRHNGVNYNQFSVIQTSEVLFKNYDNVCSNHPLLISVYSHPLVLKSRVGSLNVLPSLINSARIQPMKIPLRSQRILLILFVITLHGRATVHVAITLRRQQKAAIKKKKKKKKKE
jgi:hypothetical protein